MTNEKEKQKLSVEYIRSENFAGLKTITLKVNGKNYTYKILRDEPQWLINRFHYLKKFSDGRALNFIKGRTCLIMQEG
jgi:hypothetical protein